MSINNLYAIKIMKYKIFMKDMHFLIQKIKVIGQNKTL